jgi:hypothetical protein
MARLTPPNPALAAALTGLLALAVYWLTLARDLTWANYGVDGGELITAVLTHGSPHPPGYPLYILAGRLAYLLPLEPIAARFNLLSAICVALAAALMACIAAQDGLPFAKEKAGGITAVALGLTLAFTPLIWGQALIAEVYGLALLLLAAFLWSLFTRQPAWLIGLLLGLSATAHPTAWLMLPLALAFTPRPAWPRLLVGLAAGLLPFLALPWLIGDSSPVVWGDPGTLSGWWWLVSGQLYRGYLLALPPADWAARLVAWGPPLLAQFTWAGLPLILAGVYGLARTERRAAGWLGGTAVLYLLFAFTYLPDDAIVNSLPAWLLLGLLLLPALRRLGWLALALPPILLLLNFNGQNLRADQALRAQAETLLPAIPNAAIVATPGDGTIFALWYFQHGEGQRRDIVLVDEALFAYDWYRARLALLYPDLAALDQPEWAVFQAANGGERPFCQATLSPTGKPPTNLICSQDR